MYARQLGNDNTKITHRKNSTRVVCTILIKGLKKYQTLHTLISDEYNNTIPEYSGDILPDIKKGRNSGAGICDPITWQKSKKILSYVANMTIFLPQFVAYS